MCAEIQTSNRLVSSLVRAPTPDHEDTSSNPRRGQARCVNENPSGSGLSTLQPLYTVTSGIMKYCSNLEKFFIFFTKSISKEVAEIYAWTWQTNWKYLLLKTYGKHLNFKFWQLLTDPRFAYCFANYVYLLLDSELLQEPFYNHWFQSSSSLHLWRHDNSRIHNGIPHSAPTARGEEKR